MPLTANPNQRIIFTLVSALVYEQFSPSPERSAEVASISLMPLPIILSSLFHPWSQSSFQILEIILEFIRRCWDLSFSNKF